MTKLLLDLSFKLLILTACLPTVEENKGLILILNTFTIFFFFHVFFLFTFVLKPWRDYPSLLL